MGSETQDITDEEAFTRAIMKVAYIYINKFGKMEAAGIELDQHDKSIYNMAMALHVLMQQKEREQS